LSYRLPAIVASVLAIIPAIWSSVVAVRDDCSRSDDCSSAGYGTTDYTAPSYPSRA